MRPKKILSFLLAMILVISLLPMSAFAAQESEEPVQEEATSVENESADVEADLPAEATENQSLPDTVAPPEVPEPEDAATEAADPEEAIPEESAAEPQESTPETAVEAPDPEEAEPSEAPLEPASEAPLAPAPDESIPESAAEPQESILEPAADLYDLWIGTTNVNSENKGNIPGVSGGKASYDPDSDTLTLQNVTDVSALYDDIYMIYSKSDLTINLVGTNQLNKDKTGKHIVGIYCQGTLTVTGSGSLAINVSATDGNPYGISCTKLVLESGELSSFATINETKYLCVGLSIGELEIKGGTLTASGKTACESNVNSDSQLTIPDGYLIEASTSQDGTGAATVTKEDFLANIKTWQMSKLYKYVKFSTVSYDVWVGSVQVTSANKNDIPGVTGGSASYDPETNTLTLNNISGVDGYHNYNMITSTGDLTLNLVGYNSLYRRNPSYHIVGVYCSNTLTIKGTGVLSINVSASDGNPDGIHAFKLIMESGSLYASANVDSDNALCCGMNIYHLEIKGGTIIASGKTACESYVNGTWNFKMADGYHIVASRKQDGTDLENVTANQFLANIAAWKPNNGLYRYVKFTLGTVPDYYPIWVGKNQITSQNKDSIPGITGGRASYDPDTSTLTLENVRAVDGTHDGALLSSWQDLKIKILGTNTISGSATGSNAIYGYYSWNIYDNDHYNTTLTVGGSGNLELSVSGVSGITSGIDCSKLIMEYGILTAKASGSGSNTFGLNISGLELNGGTLTASGSTACFATISPPL